jgi:hypothetical protein
MVHIFSSERTEKIRIGNNGNVNAGISYMGSILPHGRKETKGSDEWQTPQ